MNSIINGEIKKGVKEKSLVNNYMIELSNGLKANIENGFYLKSQTERISIEELKKGDIIAIDSSRKNYGNSIGIDTNMKDTIEFYVKLSLFLRKDNTLFLNQDEYNKFSNIANMKILKKGEYLFVKLEKDGIVKEFYKSSTFIPDTILFNQKYLIYFIETVLNYNLYIENEVYVKGSNRFLVELQPLLLIFGIKTFIAKNGLIIKDDLSRINLFYSFKNKNKFVNNKLKKYIKKTEYLYNNTGNINRYFVSIKKIENIGKKRQISYKTPINSINGIICSYNNAI
jgi:hypothetical protein